MSTVVLDWPAHPPPEVRGGAVTIGNFDGVHLGHRALVAAARGQAKRIGGPAVAVTFDPPPHQVLHPASARPPLTTLPERAELLAQAGADYVVILRTSPALLALSPEAFFEDALRGQLAARAIVEGVDFRFGRGRTGNNDILRALSERDGIAFEEVAQVFHRSEPVSSSRVRSAITRGDVSLAAELLARPYRVSGTVVVGARRGRTIGFPTANLDDVETVVPANGVYAVRAVVDGASHPGAANIGPAPTFGDDARKVEVHLLDFEGELYGKAMSVEFVQRLRDTRTFASAEELTQQIQKDVAEARRVLA